MNITESVQEYYGRVLKSSSDLQTSACCTADAIPSHLRPLVADIHEEVRDKFYGCGSPIPPELAGRTVLDLGCGTGRDCFLLSRLVGEEGRVIGVDMTAEQLTVARRHEDYHAKKYGYARSNLRFVKAYIEDLRAADIADNSVDVVISNCVLNLSPDKKKVFSEIFRVLKPGGELYFSDVFASRRIPEALAKDPVLLGECLGGALYIEDFRRLVQGAGCPDYRVVSSTKFDINNEALAKKIGMVDFHSMTVRAFKLPLEDRCEDYGQVAYYKGTIPEAPHQFALDDHHLFTKGKPMLVCSNTAAMVSETRLAKHFEVKGDLTTHYGLFDCAPAATTTAVAATGAACC